ncbi:MAG: NUDIX domain-containing protein [Actinomycetota bacterium]|nr:NUDIX domain-containing protein [Actinomycetota bacterium]
MTGVGGGGVLWRTRRGGVVEVVLVHHRVTGRWELPKGKAEPGEVPSDTARREVVEEAGLDCRLAELLGDVHVRHGDTWRAIRYWLMEPVDPGAEPCPRAGTEIAEARWCLPGDPGSPLCQPYDALVLARAAEVLGNRGIVLPGPPVRAGLGWRLVRGAGCGGRWAVEREAGTVVARLQVAETAPSQPRGSLVAGAGGPAAGANAGEVTVWKRQ